MKDRLQSILISSVIIVVAFASNAAAQNANGEHLLCRFPTLHNNTIVFEAAGNLWKVDRSGGTAQLLTSDKGYDMMPRFSPDGSTIAFTGNYDGNKDVYEIPADGGHAKRLTYHSDVVEHAPTRWGPNNMVVTWTPDSQHVVFLSRRKTFNSWFSQLFTVKNSGGLPQQMPLPKGGTLTYSPDGNKIAYNRIFRNFRTWKRYYGGLAQDIWIYDLKTHQSKRITHWKGTDTFPMWYKNTIYFASDRGPNHRLNLWAYNLSTKKFRQVTHFENFDIDWPSLGNNGIVFQEGGSLYVLDLPSEKLHKINVRVPTDGTRTRPRWVKAQKQIRSFDIAPNGKRALFGARGDLFTVPSKHGPTRNLTQTSDAQEQYPAWSPNGKWIAYLTDSSGSNEIAIRPSDGSGKQKLITHTKQGFYMSPRWSPDSKKLAFSDNNNALWIASVNGGKPVKVDHDRKNNITDYSWSPGGEWLAYSKTNASGISQIYLYNVGKKKATKVSTGLYSDREPVFSPNGKYLYFISKRHANPTFSETEFNIATLKMDGIYVATLQKKTPSPFAPQSDSGVPQPKKKSKQQSASKNKPVKIDLEGLMNRVVPLHIQPGDYSNLQATGDKIFYQTRPLEKIEGPLDNSGSFSIKTYNIKKKHGQTLVNNARGYALSADGSTLLYRQHGNYMLMPTTATSKAAHKLDLSGMKTRINPVAEWTEMYNQSWRLFRDFFYNTDMNGVNWDAIHKRYSKFLPLLGSREDLNYLIGQIIAELSGSHTYVWGGDTAYHLKNNDTGVLGADFGIDKKANRYYFKKIYKGDNSREDYHSPLTEPGINISEGDYLLAINGHQLTTSTNPYKLLVNTVGKQTALTVADNASGSNKRTVTVVPIKNSLKLRLHSWIKHNREYVNKKSNGKIGYIYLSNMESKGMKQFIHQFYPQLDKQGVIIDDRYNQGGFIHPIILERLRRKLVAMSTDREKAMITQPTTVLHGYKAVLINHYSASDGDIFPYYFRKYNLGPLIGTRTWGGVRGYNRVWSLLDGGDLVVSQNSIYNTKGQWVLENHGVTPDIRVDDKPGQVYRGEDKQLDTAIDTIMKKIKQHPMNLPKPPKNTPAYPTTKETAGGGQ
ncbi:MAG TPA: S41 family peptidase [Balneolaceae bacterium]|nr:S41 family peptidase [Balneolaceae bacterium]